MQNSVEIPVLIHAIQHVATWTLLHVWQVWDDELARVAQKWSDQCADVDYNGDYKRLDPALHHDPHPQRKTGAVSTR